MAELTELTLDVDELTVGDLDVIEDMTGVPFQEALALLEKMSTKAVIAFIFVLGRQQDPSFTVEDARATKLKTLAHITNGNGNGVSTDPPPAANA